MRIFLLLIIVSFFNNSLVGQNKFIEVARKKSTVDAMVKVGLRGVISDSGIDLNHNNYISYNIPGGDSINISTVIYSYSNDQMVRYFTIIVKTPVYYKMGFKESGYEIFGKPSVYNFLLAGSKFRIEFFYDSTSGIFRTLLVGEMIQDARTGKFEEAILGRGWTVNKDEYVKSIESLFN